MSILTEADAQLLPLALRENGGFNVAARWYTGLEPLPKQYAFHQIDIPNVTWLAGIAGSKTLGVAMSYLVDCLSIPYFGALNTSVTSVQAELVFDMITGWIEGNPRLEHLIDNISLRPFPVIEFKNFSYFHFRTAGKDARFIRGSEYDRINYDEAGLDYEGLSLKTLRGRLRGKRPDETTRMARLDVTTSPTDAPWLQERFNKGCKGHDTAELDLYRSIRSTIYENIHLTREQIRLMEADYTDELIDVELRALFPDYGMTTFPRTHIEDCTSYELNDLMTMAVRPEDGKVKAGWYVVEHHRYGIVHWEIPPEGNGVYIAAGDPGTGEPPKRNAPCIMVARVDVEPWDIVYFDWISGKGSYNPFLRSFKYAIDLYNPILKGIDSTGTQKALAELAFENNGIVVEGLNFQRDKDAMLNALSIAITNHQFRWPFIQGLIKQVRRYKREDDKPAAHIPQDIVMTLAELAFLCRWLPSELESEVKRRSPFRKQRSFRTTRNARRR